MSEPQPFKIAIDQAKLDHVRSRLAGFDWNGFADTGGWDAGLARPVAQTLVNRLASDFDWRSHEARWNRLPQYTAEIDGQRIHFMHLQGATAAGLNRSPVLLIHGWPGSFVEFEAVAERLAWPERFGGRAQDALDVVIPSLPGYGFSTPLAQPIGPRRTAELYNRLMHDVLSYPQYKVQGGDWGSSVAAWLGHDYAGAVSAIHLNLVFVHARDSGFYGPEEEAYQAFATRMVEQEGGYAHIQRTRPQTLGYALHDSPAGTAAWILEKFAAWSDLPHSATGPDLLAHPALDHVLANVMLYLLTDTIVTSTWFYQGLVREDSRTFPVGSRVAVPTAVAAFGDPVFPPQPRSRAQRSYHVVRWTDMPRGGHFAALEQPILFADDLRDFVMSLEGAGAGDAV